MQTTLIRTFSECCKVRQSSSTARDQNSNSSKWQCQADNVLGKLTRKPWSIGQPVVVINKRSQDLLDVVHILQRTKHNACHARTLTNAGAMCTPRAVVMCRAPKRGAIRKLKKPPTAPAACHQRISIPMAGYLQSLCHVKQSRQSRTRYKVRRYCTSERYRQDLDVKLCHTRHHPMIL